jgi:hypothetical protein
MVGAPLGAVSWLSDGALTAGLAEATCATELTLEGTEAGATGVTGLFFMTSLVALFMTRF